MAQFDVKMPDDLFSELTKLENTEEVAEKMLKKGGEIYRKSIEKTVSGVIRNEAVSTGALVKSVKMSKVKEMKDGGHVVKITFAGTDKNGTRNGLKAAELEYGNSNQPATPFMAKAYNDAVGEATEAMLQVFNEEAGR